jgi:hypothetical protein
MNESTIISSSISFTFKEFKRTHVDNWENERLKFSEEELFIVSEFLHAPSYYA